MSCFNLCEYCDQVGKRICNCSVPSRFICDNHLFDHMNSKGGIHPFEDALEVLSDYDLLQLKQAMQEYQSKTTHKAISARNKAVNYFLKKIKKAEKVCSTIIENVLNGEMNKTIGELAFQKSLPVVSSVPFLKSLISLKRSEKFHFSYILEELSSLSSSYLSSLEHMSSTKTSSSQACPSTLSTSSQVSRPQNLSIKRFSSVFFNARTISIASSCSTKPSIFSRIFKNKSYKHYLQYTNIENEAYHMPQWSFSEQIDAHEGPKGYITSIAISDCYRYLASASGDKTIKLWNTNNCTLIRTLQGHSNVVKSVSFLEDEIISGSLDETVRIWKDSACVSILKFHRGGVFSVSVSSCKRLIASGSEDRTVIIFNVEDNKTTHTLKAHTDSVNSVAFSQDDTEIVSGSSDRTIKVWKTDTGELLRTLNGHSGNVYCVKSSGVDIVSSSGDGSLKVWQKDNEECSVSLRGHTGAVREVDTQHNIAVSIGGDKSIKVWNLDIGKEIQTLEGHGNQLSMSAGSLKLTENMRYIFSGGGDGKIKIWRRIN